MLPRKRTVKVAVVGSGLAGLTAAYRMVKGSEHREVQVEVHLFEKVSLFFCHVCTKGFSPPVVHLLASSRLRIRLSGLCRVVPVVKLD